MRRVIFSGILGAMLLGGVAFGVHWFSVARFVEATDNAYVEADIAVIAPRVAGYIASVAVTDNEAVRRGQLLATIEDTDYRVRVTAAEAEAARLRDMANAAGATSAGRAAAIREARAALAAAQAEVSRADAERARVEKLLADRFVSRQRYDAAVAEAASRRAAVAQARAALTAAEAGLSGAGAERGAALSGGRAAAAQVDAARFELANTEIRAPIDGVVGNRTARIGQYVRAGQQLMVVVPVEQAYVVANFKETQVAHMRPGMEVRLEPDAYPDVALTGRIVSLSPAAGSRFSILPPENATGNFTKIVQRIPIKVELARPLPAGVQLVPGMSVEASVDVRGDAR